MLIRFLRDESGATAIEYGLILAFIFLIIISTFTVLGGTSTGIINTAFNKLTAAMGG